MFVLKNKKFVPHMTFPPGNIVLILPFCGFHLFVVVYNFVLSSISVLFGQCLDMNVYKIDFVKSFILQWFLGSKVHIHTN